jgi:DNA-binding CsgD family transcriptional regulator
MSKMKSLLEDVQYLLESGHSVMDIAEALYIDYETAESAVEYWTHCIE